MFAENLDTNKAQELGCAIGAGLGDLKLSSWTR